MSNILTFNCVSKHYDQHKALNKVSIAIPENSIFALLGPNGSGKSTLIKIIAGLITDWDGEIKLFDNTIRTNKKYIDNFGFIIEDPAFYDYLDARKNLQIFCRLTETPFSRINEVLDIVDLLNRQFDKVSNFSYGMKQRLGIAQALLHDPKILILDEPNNGLDPVGVNKIADIVYRLKHEGKTICISTHSLNEVDRLCSDVAILRNGNLVVNKNIISEKKSKKYYRIETSDRQKSTEALSEMEGVRVLSSQSNSIIISYNDVNSSLPESRSLLDNSYVRSIHNESSLIEYYYD